MPVGFDAGAAIGGSIPQPAAWDAGERVARRVIEEVPRWELVERGQDVAEWVLETVAEVYPVDVLAWAVHPDERLCPECAIYAGEQWEADTWHPRPPLHVNCRCAEYLHHVEWRTRYVDVWRLRWSRMTWWEWDVTGWDQEVRIVWD